MSLIVEIVPFLCVAELVGRNGLSYGHLSAGECGNVHFEVTADEELARHDARCCSCVVVNWF